MTQYGQMISIDVFEHFVPGEVRQTVRKVAWVESRVGGRSWSHCLALSIQFSVYKMSWSMAQRTLVVKTFFGEGEFPVHTQRKL